VFGDEDLAQPTASVRPQNAETLSRGGRGANRARSRGMDVLSATCSGDQGQACLYAGVGDLLQFLPCRTDRADGGEALLDVVVVELEVFLDQCFQQDMSVGCQRLLFHEDLAQRL